MEKSIEQIEKERELSENVWRNRWKFSITLQENEVVLVSFKVERDEDVKYTTEGLPEPQTTESIQYVPKGTLSEYVSYTVVKAGVRKSIDDPMNRSVRITGLGDSFVVDGSSLVYGGGWDVTTGQATTMFRFEDDVVNPTKRLLITLSLKRLSIKDATELARKRRVDLPELVDTSCR